MRRATALAVVLCPAMAAAEDFLIAPPVPAVIDFAFYDSAVPGPVPLAVADAPGPVAVTADGPLWIGIGGYPARLGPVEGTDPALGVLRITAPAGATARYGLFQPDTGLLVSPLGLGDPLALPAGRFEIRRDLGVGVREIEVAPGAVTEIALGAAVLSQPLSVPVYFADPESGQVTATLPATERALALFPGIYAVATGPGLPLGRAVVVAAESVALEVTEILFQSDDPSPTALRWRGGALDLAPGEPVALVGVETGAIQVGPLDIEAVPGGPAVVWRLGSGTWPRRDGLPVGFSDVAESRLVPGGDTVLEVRLAAAAQVSLELFENERLVASWQETGRAGVNRLSLGLPDGLTPGAEAHFVATVGLPDEVRLTGQSVNRAVHVPLAAAVQDLQLTRATHTTLSLGWEPPGGASPASYILYRDGQRLWTVAGMAFEDIGLSAGQSYDYRVCPVDDLGYEGPCAKIGGRTSD